MKPSSAALYPWLRTGTRVDYESVNHTPVTTKEVVDRLRAIGTLGERVEEGRLDAALALSTAAQLVIRAFDHVEAK